LFTDGAGSPENEASTGSDDTRCGKEIIRVPLPGTEVHGSGVSGPSGESK